MEHLTDVTVDDLQSALESVEEKTRTTAHRRGRVQKRHHAIRTGRVVRGRENDDLQLTHAVGNARSRFGGP